MKILCNCCGRELRIENDVLMEDIVQVKKDWGFFSQKDGERHTFSLCEECYDEITEKFQIPVTVSDRTELL